MNISARTDYACIAVLDLAARYGAGEPVRARTIANAHGIPSGFLIQILLQLKGAGIVASTRGASGGYKLVRDPIDISLGEVMSVIEGPPGSIESNANGDTTATQALVDAWTEIATSQRQMLDSITFAELLEHSRRQTEDMYYI